MRYMCSFQFKLFKMLTIHFRNGSLSDSDNHGIGKMVLKGVNVESVLGNHKCVRKLIANNKFKPGS
jgi:hypothetical protein